MYKNSLFIFRRSLRLDDNTGLIAALKASKHVVPAFIFTPEQVVKNQYKSDNCVQFMLESLAELDADLAKKKSRLFLFFGKPDEVVKKLCNTKKIDAVFMNKDYTKYALFRDKKIERAAKKCGVDCFIHEDILLNPIDDIVSASRKPYQKYTPYLRQAARGNILKPKKNSFKNYVSKKETFAIESKKNLDAIMKMVVSSINNDIAVRGGRKSGKKILRSIKKFKDYDKNRNYLSYSTTKLSAYIKFGCVSIRECYSAFEKVSSKELLRQLFWRDFYYNIAYHFPRIFGQPLKEKYKKIKWKNNATVEGGTFFFTKWKNGKTGFPFVDASMRELNATGFMHNRGRLVVSNFLVKTLLIDWRKGEKYFAQKLVDYDPSVNNGNWQWGASCGADSQPYFRVFNPWIQSKTYDPDAKYIKKWVPELKDVPSRDIHNWENKYKIYKDVSYPKPMVDYSAAKAKTLKAFAAVF